MAIFKKWNFFDKACFLHSGNQVFPYHAYIFPSCDVKNYLYVKHCTIYAWIVYHWFVNRWMACIVNLHNPVMQVYLYGERSDAAVRCVRMELYQMQPMLFKTGVLKNFAIFTEKRLYWSLSLIKLQAFRLGTLLKGDTKQVFFCEYDEIFKLFLKNTSGGCIWCILQTGLTSTQKGWR